MQSAIPRILITGATGFVGQALCRHLVGQNFAVRVLLRDLSQAQLIPAELGAECVQADLSNVDSLRAACADMDVVIHLAGLAHVSNGPNGQSHKVNVEGTRNLLDMTIEQKIGRFIFLSSSLAQAAEAGTSDITGYGADKRAAEILLQDAARTEGNELAYLILRPVNVYGVGMKGNIANMISLIHQGRLPRLPNLSSRISLVGVEDLATALILALKATDITGKTYTITDGQQYAVMAIEQAIYSVLGKRMARWRTPAVVLYLASAVAGLLSRFRRDGGGISSRTYRNLTTDNLFSNDEICEQLGFQPSTTLYQALPDIVAEITQK